MPYQYPVLIALTAQRLWEMWLSRRQLKADLENGTAAVRAEPMWPAMVAVHAGWVGGCWWEVMAGPPAYVAWIVLPMLLVWAGALALRIWFMAALGTLWHVRIVEREDQPIVVAGPYRFIRHPNYLAVILEMAALPLLLGAYWTALLGTAANGIVLWRRIRAEEAYLFDVPAYREAFADKKRLIPGVF
jgi:methyltransferase